MLEVMAGSEPGDAYYPPPHDARLRGRLRRGSRAAAHRRTARAAGGQLWTSSSAAIFDAALETLTRMGHRLEAADVPVAALMGPFETIVLGQSAALPADRRARALGAARAPDARGRGRRRAHRRRRLRPGGRGRTPRHRGRCSTRSRPSSSSSPPCSRARPCRWTSSRSTPAAASAGAPTSSGTPTPCPSTSRASPRSRCPAARPQKACPSGCRSPGRRAPTRSCSRSPPPSSGRSL